LKKLAKSLVVFFILFMINCGNKQQQAAEKSNTAPFIRSVKVLPEKPILGSRVALRIEAGDNEGDKINYSVKWFLNGKEIGQGIEYFLSTAKKGDTLFAEITADDGKLSGEAVKSSVIRIGNTQPKITSVKIKPDTILTSTDNLTVLGEGYDPDGDPLRWISYWRLNNKERIGDSSTTISLKPLNLKKGSRLTAELYALDGDTVSLSYLVEIDIANSPPMLRASQDSIPYKGDSINYTIPITDPDNDRLTFEFLSGPKELKIDKDKGIIYGLVRDTLTFDMSVRAKDTDGAYLDVKFTLTPSQKPKP